MHPLDTAIATLAIKRGLDPPEPQFSSLPALNQSDIPQVTTPEDLGVIHERCLESKSDPSARKSRGVFYTPQRLVDHILSHTVEHAVSTAADHAPDSSNLLRAILRLRVCDPACGGGIFLIRAYRVLLKRIADMHEDVTDQATMQECKQQIATTCIRGIDIDPSAVQLTRTALWLELGDPEVHLDAFTQSIVCGDSLLGTTRAHIQMGIPDSAYATQGDDEPQHASALKEQNERERKAWQLSSDVQRDFTIETYNTWCAAFLTRKSHDSHTPTSHDLQDSHRSTQSTESQLLHWEVAFADVFNDETNPGFDAIIGNPPFLNQLRTPSTRSPRAAALLSAVTDNRIGPYTDTAAAFLLVATRFVNQRGRIGFVLPTSTLASRDTTKVRQHVMSTGSLKHLWIGDERVFEDASTFVCAPIIEHHAPQNEITRSIGLRCNHAPPATLTEANAVAWGSLASVALGVPEPDYESERTLEHIAHATADFRDEYYGLQGLIHEDSKPSTRVQDPDEQRARVITSGLIEPAECAWGERTARIHKQRWSNPVATIPRGHTLTAWATKRLVPKLLLATQTRVLEVLADVQGTYLPITPVISIYTHKETEQALYRVAAAIGSPLCVALAAQRACGTALSINAIKLAAKDVLQLPVPINPIAWDQAAVCFREASESHTRAERIGALEQSALHSLDAYRVRLEDRAGLFDWWRDRLLPREEGDPAASDRLGLRTIKR